MVERRAAPGRARHRSIGYLGTPWRCPNGATGCVGSPGAVLAAWIPTDATCLIEPTTDNGQRGVLELLERPDPPTAC